MRWKGFAGGEGCEAVVPFVVFEATDSPLRASVSSRTGRADMGRRGSSGVTRSEGLRAGVGAHSRKEALRMIDRNPIRIKRKRLHVAVEASPSTVSIRALPWYPTLQCHAVRSRDR